MWLVADLLEVVELVEPDAELLLLSVQLLLDVGVELGVARQVVVLRLHRPLEENSSKTVSQVRESQWTLTVASRLTLIPTRQFRDDEVDSPLFSLPVTANLTRMLHTLSCL